APPSRQFRRAEAQPRHLAKRVQPRHPAKRVRRAQAKRVRRALNARPPASFPRLSPPPVLRGVRSTLSSPFLVEQLQILNPAPVRNFKDLLLAPVVISCELMDASQQPTLRLLQVADRQLLKVEVKITGVLTVRANNLETRVDQRIAFLHRSIDLPQRVVVQPRDIAQQRRVIVANKNLNHRLDSRAFALEFGGRPSALIEPAGLSHD